MKELFEQFFGVKIPEGTSVYKINCLWHDDKDPSLTLYVKDGNFRCYGCGKAGNIKDVASTFKVIDEKTVEQFHQNLLDEPKLQEWLFATKGINLDSIKALRIGHNGGRFTFPVRNNEGQCVNLRMYSSTATPKIVSFAEGFGKPSFFPFPPTEEVIFLTEGESDTILARQLGLPAYCQTSGAGTWTDELTRYLVGKIVHIIYDVDRAGRLGAAKVINHIKFVAKEIRNLRLPVSPESKDFSDWVLKDGGTQEDLKALISDTPPYVVSKSSAEIEDPATMKLWETEHSKWAFKPVQCDVMVAGKDRAPYLVPRAISVECSVDKKTTCSVCPNSSGQKNYVIDWRDGKLIGFVDMHERDKDAQIKKSLDIPMTCRSCRITVTEYQNVEKLALYPRKDWMTVSDHETAWTPVLRRAYFIGSGVQANNLYRITAIPVPDHRDQVSVLLIVEAEPLEDTDCSDIDKSKCEYFRVEDKDGQVADDGKRESDVPCLREAHVHVG